MKGGGGNVARKKEMVFISSMKRLRGVIGKREIGGMGN